MDGGNLTQDQTLLIWELTLYGRCYLRSTLIYHTKMQTYVPLPKEAAHWWGVADDGWRVADSPPTEDYAMTLWTLGWIPGRAYTEGKYFVKRKYVDAAVLPADHDCTEHRRHHRAIGRICCECGERKPLTPHYWHRNKDGKDGWHSVCKVCRNHVERTRIAEKRMIA